MKTCTLTLFGVTGNGEAAAGEHRGEGTGDFLFLLRNLSLIPRGCNISSFRLSSLFRYGNPHFDLRTGNFSKIFSQYFLALLNSSLRNRHWKLGVDLAYILAELLRPSLLSYNSHFLFQMAGC